MFSFYRGDVFYTGININRVQIFCYCVFTGKKYSFIITDKNKNFSTFLNEKDMFIFSAEPFNTYPGVLKKFKKFSKQEYPEYYI